MKKWKELQKIWHSPKYSDWDVTITTGSQDGCNKMLEMIVNEGDPLMVQMPMYAGLLSSVNRIDF